MRLIPTSIILFDMCDENLTRQKICCTSPTPNFSEKLRCFAVEIRAAPGPGPGKWDFKSFVFSSSFDQISSFFLKSAQLSVLFCFFDFQARALTVFSWPRRDRGTALVEIQHWQYISCQNQLIKYCAAKYCAKCSLSLNCFPSPTLKSKQNMRPWLEGY